jgi:L-amino acid N-acyltransferase YncA
MAYRHRLATAGDLPAIVEIYNHAVRARSSTCDLEPVSVASRQAWFDALATTIFAGNEPSLRLFRSHGFQQWGRLPGVAELDGVSEDVVFVGRRVG